MPKEMNLYICSDCHHEVYAYEKPLPFKWDDGHVCRFVLHVEPVIDLEEASENQDDDDDEQDDYGYEQQGKSFD